MYFVFAALLFAALFTTALVGRLLALSVPYEEWVEKEKCKRERRRAL